MSTPAQAKVAVITRTKNRPVLLRRALASVAAQTYADYTHVVVNDAGDAPSVDREVAGLAQEARAKVHVLHRTASTGMESASNHGIERSDSQYLVIHDDDDAWDPTFLERTVARLEASAHGAVAVRTEVVYESVADETVTELSREILAADKHDVTLFEVLRRNYIPPISLLYRRSLHDEVGLYDEGLPVLGDWDFILRVLRTTQIDFIDGPPLAFWHHRRDAAGDMGNSVIAGADSHSAYDRVIRDRFLRAEIAKGGNIGSLLYFTELLDRVEKITTIRHEQNLSLLHNINNTTAKLENDLDSRLYESTAVQRGLTHELHEMNRNLVAQNNRFVAQLEALAGQVHELEELVFAQTPRQRLKAWKALSRRKAGGVARRVRSRLR